MLFVAANPRSTSKLSLDEEMRAITEKIRASEYRNLLELEAAWAARPDDLLQSLNIHKPHIVHFSGHGSSTGEIILVNGSGLSKAVSTNALKALFTTLKDNIQVILLNACYSRLQAEALVDVIDCVIGMNNAIGDQAALIFASSFYRAIGFGRSIQEAFDQGRTALLLEGIPEEDTPELLVKAGINPSLIILAKRQVQRKGKGSNKVAITRAIPSNSRSFVQVPKSELANSTSKSKSEDFVLIHKLQGHTGYVWKVAISPDGQTLVSRGNEDTIKTWSLLTGQLLYIITERFAGATALTISPDGQYLASGFSKGIKVWHLSTGKLLKTFAQPDDTVNIAISPDGQILTVKDFQDEIMVFHLPTSQLLRSLKGYASRNYNIVVSPDGQTLARGNEDGTITLWDWLSGNLLHLLKGNSQIQYKIEDQVDGRELAVYNLCFSPDGQILASRNEDGTISVWNYITGKLLTTFVPPIYISDVRFSSNGQTLYGRSSRSIVAWHLPNELLIGSLNGYSDNISDAISSDGQYIAMGNKNGTITIWRKNELLNH